MIKRYMIGMKRVKDYKNAILTEEKQRYEYAQYDNYAGSFSTGYPVFGDELHAIKFDSIEKAKEWWEKNEIYMSPPYIDYGKYDVKTLGVMENIIIYNPVEKL